MELLPSIPAQADRATRVDPEIGEIEATTRERLRGALDFLGIIGSGVAGTAAFLAAEATVGPIVAGAVAAGSGWVVDQLSKKGIAKAMGPDPSQAA